MVHLTWPVLGLALNAQTMHFKVRKDATMHALDLRKVQATVLYQ